METENEGACFVYPIWEFWNRLPSEATYRLCRKLLKEEIDRPSTKGEALRILNETLLIMRRDET